MADHLSSLLASINKLIQGHRRLLGLARQQGEALIQGDNARLQTIVEAMRGEIEQIGNLEALRMDAITALVAAHGIPERERTASGLARTIQMPKRVEFLRLTGELKTVMDELHVLNQRNEELTAQSLTYNARMMEWIASCSTGFTYGKNAVRDGMVSPRFISVQT